MQVTEEQFHADNYLFVFKNRAKAFVAVVLYNSENYTDKQVEERKPVVEGYTLDSVVMEAHRWCKDNPPVEFGVIVDESLL